jgi:hypothetical protein
LFDYNNPSIHYSKDILDKCTILTFYFKSDGPPYTGVFFEIEDGGLSFFGNWPTAHFESDVEVTRLKNEILLSDKGSKLKISVHRNRSNIKVYDIQFYVNEEASSYEQNDFEYIYYSDYTTTDVVENMTGNDYTALDFIESMLKKLNFKIKYK